MIALVAHKRSRKAEDTAARARAASDANRAILAALEGHSGDDQRHRADAILDAAITANAAIHGPDVTAPRLSATSGRIFPAVDRVGLKDAAEAVFWKGRAA